MKKLLYQFDTDALPSVFDNVVGYDGGADHISAYGGVNAKNVGGLVEGAIFTRGLKDKKNNRDLHRGGNLIEGEAVLAAVRRKFFAKFRVSVMFDCNGSNTTASAAVAWLAHGAPRRQARRGARRFGSGRSTRGRAVGREGALVAITGRKPRCRQAACDSIHARFGIVYKPSRPRPTPTGAAIDGAQNRPRDGAAGITCWTRSSGRIARR